jgi:thymidylate kinase
MAFNKSKRDEFITELKAPMKRYAENYNKRRIINVDESEEMEELRAELERKFEELFGSDSDDD